MKQIKLILSTILLLLLLTSISYGWVPPNINSPVLLDEMDADPWGETISCHNYDKAVSEPPRGCRRVNNVRYYSYGKTKQIFTGGSGTGRADG